MQTVLVTGANGFVGSHVVRRLLSSGHSVVGLIRGAGDGEALVAQLPAEFRGNVRIRIGDITRPETLAPAMADVDAVVHLAAIPRDWNDGLDLDRVNTGGTAAVLDAARRAGVRRFVHLGALGVADVPALHYASSKARAERLVAESGLDWTILKPSLLWGPGDGFFSLIAGLVRMSPGAVPIPGLGTARFQPLAVDDLATIVVLALERPDTIGRSYELGGPEVWTYREIVAEVLGALGKRRLIIPMPVPAITLVAAAAERVHLPFPVATDQLRQLRLDNVAAPDGVERAFGFAPQSMQGQLGYLRRRQKAS